MRSADWVFPLGSDTTSRFSGWPGAGRLRLCRRLDRFRESAIPLFNIREFQPASSLHPLSFQPVFLYLIRTCNSSDSGKRSFLQLPSWPQEEEAQCGLLGSRTVPHTYSQRISTPPASTFIRRVISTGPLSAFKSSRTHRSPSSALISSDPFPAVDRGTVSASGADSLSCAPPVWGRIIARFGEMVLAFLLEPGHGQLAPIT